jgi:hypothetical protein
VSSKAHALSILHISVQGKHPALLRIPHIHGGEYKTRGN